MIGRRPILTVLCTMPLIVTAQPARKVWRIGYLGAVPAVSAGGQRMWAACVVALRERGYVEGENLAFVSRYSEGRSERLPALAGELAALGVDVIVADDNVPSVRAAQRATRTIPIVMTSGSDPVAAGLVASLARPGGNVTGVADLQVDLIPKRIEMLKLAVPGIARVVILQVLRSASTPRQEALKSQIEAAARSLGVTMTPVAMASPEDFTEATRRIAREHPDALLLSPNPVNFLLRTELAAFARERRLPTIASRYEEAGAGILMAYGPSPVATARLVAGYVDRIVRGANPAALPVEQPSTFELIINVRTARALGLALPQPLLLRADKVIE